MSCHAFELFIDNVRWLHPKDSTATASTNISNYFCALWPKRHIELFTNVVEISQSSQLPDRKCTWTVSQMEYHVSWKNLTDSSSFIFLSLKINFLSRVRNISPRRLSQCWSCLLEFSLTSGFEIIIFRFHKGTFLKLKSSDQKWRFSIMKLHRKNICLWQ